MEKCEKPKNWLDAFVLLEKFLQNRDDGSRQVIFLDEFPWLDTPKSGFIRAFEAFWNTWGCHRKNLMVIVCGSANSWIQDKLLNNHGGLYNRFNSLTSCFLPIIYDLPKRRSTLIFIIR